MKKLKFKHRLKLYKVIVVIALILVLVITCWAAADKISDVSLSNRFDFEHDAVAILVSVIGWLVIRTITKTDKAMDLLFKKNDERKGEHDILRSEFDIIKGRCNYLTQGDRHKNIGL